MWKFESFGPQSPSLRLRTGKGCRDMRRTELHKRAVAQEIHAPAPCPRCQAITDMSDKELDRKLVMDLEFFEGRGDYLGSQIDLPDHSPTCPLYQMAISRSEKEAAEAKLARLTEILRARGREPTAAKPRDDDSKKILNPDDDNI